MKRIWIDGYEANVQQRLGSGQVAYELLKNIYTLDHENDYTVLLPDKPLPDLPQERENFKYKILKPKRLWTRIALPIALFLSKNKPDVFFTPTHYLPRFCPSSIKKVVTIFDLSYLHFPEMFNKDDLYKLKNWTKYSVEEADHIITISQSTKKDLIKNYQIDKGSITVLSPGYDDKIFYQIKNIDKISEIKTKYGISGDYIIYAGTIQPRKNLVRLIEAFSRLHPEGVQLNLVIVGKAAGLGKQGWMYEEILNKPKSLGIDDRVKFTGFVPTSDLPYLISGSIAAVQPSLYEGFGITLVEAMACGTPVLSSNVSSLPEVVGKAGLLFNPLKVDQIEVAIRTVLADKKLRIKLSKLGLAQAKKFSWKKIAKGVVKVLESI